MYSFRSNASLNNYSIRHLVNSRECFLHGFCHHNSLIRSNIKLSHMGEEGSSNYSKMHLLDSILYHYSNLSSTNQVQGN